MKSFIKPLSIVTTTLYILGMIFLVYYLYNLPNYLLEHSNTLDLNGIQEIKPVLNNLTLYIVTSFFVGLIAIVLVIAGSTKDSGENIVYIEKFNSNKEETEQEQGKKDNITTVELDKNLLGKIKEAINSKQSEEKIMEMALRAVCNSIEAGQGAVYVTKTMDGKRFIELQASYAYIKPESATVSFEYGEGLPGQIAKEGIITNLDKVPEGYIQILSGLGHASPNHLLLAPIKDEEDHVLGVVEIASFTKISSKQEKIVLTAFGMLRNQFKAAAQKANPEAETEKLLNKAVERKSKK